MSFHSEHMKITLVGLRVRGDVEIVPISKVRKMNEKTIRLRSRMLYGNTKFTDELILFFLIKHNFNGMAAARDIKCSYQTILYRCKKFNIKLEGMSDKTYRKYTRKYSDAQIIVAHHKNNGNCSKIARQFAASRTTVRIRCRKLGLKLQGRGRPKKK